MSIAWNDSLALGEAIIDEDHRRMIDLITRLEEAAAGRLVLEAVGPVLDELTLLCREHFRREEALQDRIGFPDREAHAGAHVMLMKRLEAIQAHYEAGDREVREGIVRTLGDSLATWLLSHITNSDMEFKPYMR